MLLSAAAECPAGDKSSGDFPLSPSSSCLFVPPGGVSAALFAVPMVFLSRSDIEAFFTPRRMAPRRGAATPRARGLRARAPATPVAGPSSVPAAVRGASAVPAAPPPVLGPLTPAPSAGYSARVDADLEDVFSRPVGASSGTTAAAVAAAALAIVPAAVPAAAPADAAPESAAESSRSGRRGAAEPMSARDGRATRYLPSELEPRRPRQWCGTCARVFVRDPQHECQRITVSTGSACHHCYVNGKFCRMVRGAVPLRGLR